jgi:signal transduction histidine kinase
VFEKFYRTGNENVRKAKGTGLGLYLCRKIVEQHNGKIIVTDNMPQGSIFTITFIV